MRREDLNFADFLALPTGIYYLRERTHQMPYSTNDGTSFRPCESSAHLCRRRASNHQQLLTMASNAASLDKLFIVLIITIICLCISSIYISTKLESKHHKEPPIQLRSFVAKGASKNSDVPVLISESHKQQAAATGDKRQQKQLQQQLQQQQQQTSSYPNGPKQDVKYKNDRVYCMVPFVYNKDFHTTIMQTWGRRCNVINFLTDSIVLKDQDTIKFRGDLVIGSDNNKRKKNKNDIDDMWKPYWEFPPDSFPDNVIFLNMTRSWSGCKDDKTGKPKICRHIWEKMWRSWVYVAEHHLHDAEWFCKVDYDTFFFPENLQYYVRDVKKWDPINEYYYFGQLLAKNNPPLIAGAAACWSQKTLRDVAQVYRDMPKGSSGGARPGICEDRAKAAEEVTTATCLKKPFFEC